MSPLLRLLWIRSQAPISQTRPAATKIQCRTPASDKSIRPDRGSAARASRGSRAPPRSDWRRPRARLELGLEAQAVGDAAEQRGVEQLLRRADRVGAAVRDLARERRRVAMRVVAHVRREPKRNGLGPRDDPRGERELLRHVEADDVAQRLRERDVGYETPVRLADRELRIGRHEADVGAERDLETRPVGHAVHGRDHGHRQLLPDPGGALREVRRAVGRAVEQLGAGAVAPAETGERREVDPARERAAFAREHHGAHRRVARERLARLDQRDEHRQVERVHLLRAHHPHVGDPVLLVDADPFLHGVPPSLAGPCENRARNATRLRAEEIRCRSDRTTSCSCSGTMRAA